MCLRNSSGVPPSASTVCACSDLTTSSDFSASLAAFDSLSMIGCGVPAGAAMPNHSTETQSGTPASIMVGKFGKERAALGVGDGERHELAGLRRGPTTVEAGEK